MHCALAACLFAVLLLAFRITPMPAQSPPTEGKSPEPIKSTDPGKPKISLDKIKLPPAG